MQKTMGRIMKDFDRKSKEPQAVEKRSIHLKNAMPQNTQKIILYRGTISQVKITVKCIFGKNGVNEAGPRENRLIFG
jgi:hypothetical protein